MAQDVVRKPCHVQALTIAELGAEADLFDEAVLASGATLSGPTVHLVSTEYDKGHIVAQWPVPVKADDTPDALAARVLKVEHQLLPAVVLAAARAGRVVRLTTTEEHFDAGTTPASLHDRLGPR